ncbi:uncharacterized protein LOC129891579 isoform X2 [Solanum dulcamara]|uniref:uncharacterized protein LOC129891579 isoform X2 n=1 Tax=Solanum dulcamara TaxID=45834 RepID=UPI002486765D|nr:uncharacterized protein LOC129891579 isoform X2 [Solanum dulcamara]
MPDFGLLLDPPLPSAPEESLSSSLALISCPNLEVSSESDTQMHELVADRNSQLGFPIPQKEELKPVNNGCVELEQKEDELGISVLIPKSSESDTQMKELVSDRNSQLGITILLKEDELNPENNGCVELEQKDDLKLENNGFGELGISVLIPKFSQSDTQMQELVSDRNSQLGFPILLKEEVKPDNNGCVELELKEDELKLEKNGYGELGIRDLIPKSSQSDTQMQELVSERNSQLGFPILQKEELKPDNNGCVELKLEDSGCGELGISVLITKSSESDTQMQELVSDRNYELGFPILQKEDELKPESNGCVELEQKEDELKLENNGCSEFGIRDLIPKSSQFDTQMLELVADRNSQLEFPILQKEDELKPESNGFGELEQKEDELKLENNGCGELGIQGLRPSGGGSVAKKSLDEFVIDWVERRVNAGMDKRKCVLPFLIHAPKSVECSVCQRSIFPGDEVECSVRDCTLVFHLECAKERLGLSSPKMFKCPQHVCYVCNKKIHLWRCIRCPLASHDKCAAFPEHVVHLNDQPGRVICWKHPSDWHLEKHEVPSSNLEEIFANLPVPYVDEEFKIDINWKDMIDNRSEPPPYVHIKRNAYLIKKKRDGDIADIGCTNCKSTECLDNCVCRVQCISCSKACHCSDTCSNRPFRRDRRIKVVKTELCGWGVVALESINKVIDDALCEKRLWDMKYKGVQNFYMCELRKDFTIDATFKGNLSRFLNHSCDPNCKLEKWQVEGETRVGVFAARYIEVEEPLTYDYRFVQFGSEVKCHCGASNCQGYLGSKKKITSKLDICWGSKRKRTSTSCLAIIKSNSC